MWEAAVGCGRPLQTPQPAAASHTQPAAACLPQPACRSLPQLNFYSGLLDKAFGGEEEDYDMRQAIRRCVVVFLCVVSCVWSRRAIHILMAGIDACRRRSFLENETSERALR